MNCTKCGKEVYVTSVGICLQCIHDLPEPERSIFGKARQALDKIEVAENSLEEAKELLNSIPYADRRKLIADHAVYFYTTMDHTYRAFIAAEISSRNLVCLLKVLAKTEEKPGEES